MNLVYICSPLHGDMAENIKKANRYSETAARMGVVPLAPHTIFTKYLNDDIPEQRERGLNMGLALLRRCDELWVCGNVISPGMHGEIEFAKKNGIPIKFMKEVFDLNVKADLKKLQTQKSIILQQYQPIYTAYYDITVDKDVGNFAKVCFDTGKEVTVDGARHALDFLKMEFSEAKKAVDAILSPLITAEQDKLFGQLELGGYKKIYPFEGEHTPYLVLDQNDYARFAYCPITPHGKFATLIHNDYGKPFAIDHQLYGSYSDRLSDMLFEDARLDTGKIFEVLKEVEPVAVREYQEQAVIQKLNQLTAETGARPFVFHECDSTPALINLPAEAEDVLTPEEIEIAKDLITQQTGELSESALSESDISESSEPLEGNPDYNYDEDIAQEMCM